MCAMGFPAAAAAVDLERTNARTRRIRASAVRVTALMLHAEAFPQAFLQRCVPLGGVATPFVAVCHTFGPALPEVPLLI